MDQLPVLGDVQSWPQAVVAVVLILALVVWPGFQAQRAGRRTKDLKRTLTENNGGSTVKDQLDRIESGQRDLADRVSALEAARQPQGLIGRWLR